MVLDILCQAKTNEFLDNNFVTLQVEQELKETAVLFQYGTAKSISRKFRGL